jgi:hypothetical protein
VASVAGDFLPAFVKHLLFPKPKLASVARPISPTDAMLNPKTKLGITPAPGVAERATRPVVWREVVFYECGYVQRVRCFPRARSHLQFSFQG